MQEGFLAMDTVTELVKQQHARLERVERLCRGTAPYRGGVVLRYNPLATCNPAGAGPLLARYKFWKDRGLPVSVVWDEQRADETVPEQFEFALEGDDTRDTDLAIRSGDGSHVATLTNLRNTSRDLRLRVRLRGQDMGRYEAHRIDEIAPVTVERSAGNLTCSIHLPPLACAVVRLATM
jgi:hypothetical protein